MAQPNAAPLASSTTVAPIPGTVPGKGSRPVDSNNGPTISPWLDGAPHNREWIEYQQTAQQAEERARERERETLRRLFYRFLFRDDTAP
jgi:hypothetical protein